MEGYGVVVAALFSCMNDQGGGGPTYSLQCTTKECGVALEVRNDLH